MMLSHSFDSVLGVPLERSMTLRVTTAERMKWDYQAKALGLSTSKFIRTALASDEVQRKVAKLLAKENARKDYAVLLQALGKSRIASNLNQLAYHANVGTLNCTPDVVTQINEAYDAIMHIRTLLIQGTGGRPC